MTDTKTSQATESDDNLFEDLGFSPDEAVDLRLRAQVMRELERWFRESGMTQAQAAEELGVSQARISNLVNGRFNQFSLDMLVRLATRAGIKVEIHTHPTAA